MIFTFSGLNQRPPPVNNYYLEDGKSKNLSRREFERVTLDYYVNQHSDKNFKWDTTKYPILDDDTKRAWKDRIEQIIRRGGYSAAAGFDGDPVELPSDSESALLSLLSDRAPVERTSIAELNLVGAFSSLPMFGAAQILQPVPLPASAWLLIAALTSIAVRARTVGRARD